MFRQLATQLIPPIGLPGTLGEQRARAVFAIHPLQLSRYAEEAWAAAPPGVFLGNAAIAPLYGLNPVLGAAGPMRSAIDPSPPAIPQLPLPAAGPAGPAVSPAAAQPWDHLMYAYLIENTGIVRIFAKVLDAYLTGESLEVPDDETRLWLRATEELFFADTPAFHVTSLTSAIRPDLEATRRNAYWRLFGMDLNHGGPGGQPYAFVKGAGANTTFVRRWEQFLTEVWQGYLNRKNSSGENAEDPEAVAEHAEALSNMLRARRQRGNLAREEFAFVSMMSWFHLTIEYSSPVVAALKAEAPSAAERLAKVAARVGVQAHPKAKNFLDMAGEASTILRAIEVGLFNTAATAPVLYDDTPVNPIRSDVLAIVNNWSAATGVDVKQRRQGATEGRRSRRSLAAASSTVGSGDQVPVVTANGHR